MPNFSYKALGRDGKEVRGVLQAESEAAAASRIRENYPILLSISQKKEKKRPDEGSLLEMEIGILMMLMEKKSTICLVYQLSRVKMEQHLLIKMQSMVRLLNCMLENNKISVHK